MKSPIKRLTTIALCLWVFNSQAAVPMLLWESFKHIALGVAGNVVYSWGEQELSPANRQQLSADIQAKLKQLDQYSDVPHAEIKSLQDQLKATQQILKIKANKQLSPVQKSAKIAQLLPKTGVLSKKRYQDRLSSLDLTYVYWQAKKGQALPLKNGSVLHSGDAYKLVFKPKTSGYVYAFQRDSSGKIWPLFPTTQVPGAVIKHHSPVKAGKTYHIPSKSKALFLDDTVGTEQIYFFFSPKPDPFLEKMPSFGKLQQALLSRGPGGILNAPSAVNMAKVSLNQQPATKISLQKLIGNCASQQGCVLALEFQHR